MTAHINDQILAAAKDALDALATTGDRIDEWELRVKQVAEPRLVIAVSCQGAETGAQGNQQREIEVLVTGYAKKTSGMSATLGSIQAEVEVALAAAGTLGGLLATGLRFVRDQRDIDYSLEHPAGMVATVFSGLCFTRANNPTAIA